MTSLSLFEHLHFLRPLWLLAMLPAIILALYFWQQKSSAANWHGAINTQLLQHLVDGQSLHSTRWPWLLLLSGWLIAALAMAGPSWQKLPQPIHQKQDALVIVFDLSLSMLAEDIKPSRLVRARHKVLDLLKQREEGVTALIAYAGDAHVVSPLTDDSDTIANLVPALSPLIMPAPGSNPVAATSLARELVSNAGLSYGRVLLITDGITASDVDAIDNSLQRASIALSVLGMATTDGAPIPTDEGFLKDRSGSIVVPQLQRAPMEQLARLNNGRYTDVSLSDDDLGFLLAAGTMELDQQTVLTEREFDQWHDRGPLLVLLILPLALLAFRRDWLLLVPLLLLVEPNSSYALGWDDLWQRPDQQAAQALQQGDAASAAEQFQNQQWRGTAHYQSGNFEQAAEAFGRSQTADAHYNRGNALAKAGKIDEAIAAYQQALQLQPDMDDAQANKHTLEQLKQQQQQQQNSDADQQDQQSSDQQQDSEQQQNAADNKDPQNQPGQNQQGQPSPQPGEDASPEQPPSPQSAQPDDSSDDQSQETSPPASEQTEQAAQQTPTEASPDADTSSEATAAEADPENRQQQQAMEQWLRKIPDDPSGLLRRKFQYQYRVRQQQGDIPQEQPQW